MRQKVTYSRITFDKLKSYMLKHPKKKKHEPSMLLRGIGPRNNLSLGCSGRAS
jgi:hypothetical protein